MTGEANGKTLHGTALALNDAGILLLGPAGSGKSDIALRLIERGMASLVADDRVGVIPRQGTLHLVAPEACRGLLEVRGIGIAELPFKAFVPLLLVVQLIPADPPGSAIERLPEPEYWTHRGIDVPLIRIDPFEASAIEKLSLAVRARRRLLSGP
ncbi:MAG: HPr kinase/phosphatase C-terminal domain-containing protein [Alphaproteobacteria bacterium]|nr:HPr kinase/phosphatase C-terminal domain-containing protein [Alphaproteobacteria bacterium]